MGGRPSDEVSTGSGRDRVIVMPNSTVAWIETRSHPPPRAGCPRGDPGPLPVLTSSPDPLLGSRDFVDLTFQGGQCAQHFRIPAAIVVRHALCFAVHL